jgi:uncharacterized protein with PIN domain
MRRIKRAAHNLPVGEDHHSARMTEAQVRELRRLHHEVGICCRCASKVVGVNRSAGYDAINFYTWKHVR